MYMSQAEFDPLVVKDNLCDLSSMYSPSHHGLNLVKQVVNYEKFHFFVKDGDRIEPGGRGNISQAALFIKTMRMVKTHTLPLHLTSKPALAPKKVHTGAERGAEHSVLWHRQIKCYLVYLFMFFSLFV